MDDRSRFIGGSDAGGILGLSKWKTPLDVFYSKVGYPLDAPPMDPNRVKILRRGKLMEPVVVKMLAAEYPIRITKRSSDKKPNRYRDSKLPFLAAEVDFEWRSTPEMWAEYPGIPPIEGTLNGEVKTSNPFAANVYGEEGTDELPLEYACQAMHGLGITGREACLVPVLVGSDNLRLYHVLRNDDLIRVMREKCERFWKDNVLAKKPPAPADTSDVYRILRVRNDIVVQADETLRELVGDLVECNEVKAAAAKRAEDAQFAVVKHLVGENAEQQATVEGRHVIMSGGQKLLTVTKQTRETVQAKLLKEAHPDIYDEYVKTSTFFVCRTSRLK